MIKKIRFSFIVIILIIIILYPIILITIIINTIIGGATELPVGNR